MAGNMCVYDGCGDSRRRTPGLRLFRIPTKDPEVTKRWLENCGNTELRGLSPKTLYKKVVCENHFQKADITTNGRLRWGTVPLPHQFKTEEQDDSDSLPERSSPPKIIRQYSRKTSGNNPNTMARQLDRIEYYLKTGKYPADISSNRGDKSNFRRAAKPYALSDGKLMYKYALTRKVKSPELLRVIKDISERLELLQSAHEVVGTSAPAETVGSHLGRDKTHAKLIEAGVFWPDMNKDVRHFVKTCSFCRKGDTGLELATSDLQSGPVSRSVWEQVEVDTYQLVETSEGYKGILMVWDRFSKWVEAKPIKTASAKDVAEFLHELICRYSYPRIQINDKSREFVEEVKERLLYMTGFDLRITNAHHSQENGLIERADRNGLGGLLKALSDHEERWQDRLQGILFAYRTSLQQSTGLTPFELMYGRKAVVPRQLNNDDGTDETGFGLTANDLVEVKIEPVDEGEDVYSEFTTDIKVENDEVSDYNN